MGQIRVYPSPNEIANHEVFRDLWNTIDQHYGLFGIKAVDWNALGRHYSARASRAATNIELFDLLAEMLSHLKDKHVWLVGGDRAWNCRMAEPCCLADIDGIVASWKAPFSETLIYTKYVHDQIILSPEIAGGFLAPTVAYLRISAFPDDARAVGDASDQALQALSNARRLVIDVRDNRGGSDRGAKAVADRFADRSRLFMTTAVRAKGNRGELTSQVAWRVEPCGPRQFLNPVALLVNRDTFSAGETFTLAMHALPHVTIFGEPTAGAFSDTCDSRLPNGWEFTYSRGEWRDAHGNAWEECGFPPDVVVPVPDDSIPGGCDAVIDWVIASSTTIAPQDVGTIDESLIVGR